MMGLLSSVKRRMGSRDQQSSTNGGGQGSQQRRESNGSTSFQNEGDGVPPKAVDGSAINGPASSSHDAGSPGQAPPSSTPQGSRSDAANAAASPSHRSSKSKSGQSREMTKLASDGLRNPPGSAAVGIATPPPSKIEGEKRNGTQRTATQGKSSEARSSHEDFGLIIARQNPTIFQQLPSLKGGGDQLELLKKKLSACTDVIFDFKHQDLYVAEKEAKRCTLVEIADYIQGGSRPGLELFVEDLMRMISANIFRPLPPPSPGLSNMLIGADPEESEPSFEPSWPHLMQVYEILLRFVVSNDMNPKAAKKYIDHTFVIKLLELFNSEDPRERDYLKTIMHRVYGKIMALRAFIRRAIQHLFFRFIYEGDIHHGIGELLEILGSIINGFAQPLKEEHKHFLIKSMIPLHKSTHLITYHQQLSYCMTQYIEKDVRLIEPIVLGLLKYWPVTNTPKEVLLLNELEEILEITPPAEFQKIMEPLFKRLALCIQSPHFQVSERVLFLWNNTRIVKLVNQNKNILFPIVIGALYRNTKEHWNSTVHGLTFNVCKLLAEADPDVFDYCNDENIKQEEKRERERETRRQQWLALQKRFEEKHGYK